MSEFREALPETWRILQEGRTAGLHLGAQLHIVQRGRIVIDAAIGENRPGQPLTSSHWMLWLSASKPVTAVAIGRLWEAARLSLEEPVCSYLPEFAARGKETITLVHLLTHTGGFRGADAIPEELSWPDTVARICAAPLEPGWVPGEKAGYHISSTWFVLAELVQRLSGVAFSDYIRHRIFEPAGMTDSWIGMPHRVYARVANDGLALMYQALEQPPIPVLRWNEAAACIHPSPGKNGRGPVRDLARFYQMLLQGGLAENGNRLLAPETVRALTARRRVGMFDHTFRHTMDWGLGFLINSNRYGADTVPYGYGRFASENTFGHSGSQSSCAFADPEHELVVVWACNGMPGERRHQKRARQINEAIYSDLGLR